MPPPTHPHTPGVLFLKQGDSAGCHCSSVFHDLRNGCANREPDAPRGFPPVTTNSLMRVTVKESELQRYW